MSFSPEQKYLTLMWLSPSLTDRKNTYFLYGYFESLLYKQ